MGEAISWKAGEGGSDNGGRRLQKQTEKGDVMSYSIG